MEYTEASGWETRGFNFYRELNNQILRGVPQAAAAMDKTVLLWAERWFDARIAGFRQQDCNFFSKFHFTFTFINSVSETANGFPDPLDDSYFES